MSVWQKLFGFRGRINRYQFWLWILLVILANLVFLTVTADWIHSLHLAPGSAARHNTLRLSAAASLLLAAVSAWAVLALMVKRAHDIGRGGLWLLLGLIPVLGQLLLIYGLFLRQGPRRANRYGERPGHSDRTQTVQRILMKALTRQEPAQSDSAAAPAAMTPPPPDLPAGALYAHVKAPFPEFVPPTPVASAPGEPRPHPVMALTPPAPDLAWLEFTAYVPQTAPKAAPQPPASAAAGQ